MTTGCLHFSTAFVVNQGVLSGRCSTCGTELSHDEVIAATNRIAKVDNTVGELRTRGHVDGAAIIDGARRLHDLHMEREQAQATIREIDLAIEAHQAALQPLLERHEIPPTVGRELVAGNFDALLDAVTTTATRALPAS
jgi:hypothetical protein